MKRGTESKKNKIKFKTYGRFSFFVADRETMFKSLVDSLKLIEIFAKYTLGSELERKESGGERKKRFFINIILPGYFKPLNWRFAGSVLDFIRV